jgi:hypothetical protein
MKIRFSQLQYGEEHKRLIEELYICSNDAPSLPKLLIGASSPMSEHEGVCFDMVFKLDENKP